MKRTFKYITTIIGAGAVLDFDYEYPNSIIPSTKNITNAIRELKVQDIDNKELDVISQVYNLVNNKFSCLFEKSML